MPGDAVNSGIGFLDVQFGALEFGSDSSSVDGSANEKYNCANSTISNVDMTSGPNTVNTANTNNTIDIATTQTSTTAFNSNSQMVGQIILISLYTLSSIIYLNFCIYIFRLLYRISFQKLNYNYIQFSVNQY